MSPQKFRDAAVADRLISKERVSDSEEDADAELSPNEVPSDTVERRTFTPLHLSTLQEQPHTLEHEISHDEGGSQHRVTDTPTMKATTPTPIVATAPEDSLYEEVNPSQGLTSSRSLKSLDPSVAHWFQHLQLPREDSSQFAQVSIAPRLQQKMLDAAVAIAGPKSAEDWQTFFGAWRKSGWLALRPVSRDQGVQAHLQQYPVAIQDFYKTYNRVEMGMATDMWRAITHRFAMRDLWTAFFAACESVSEDELPMDSNRSILKSRQRQYLFGVLHPELRGTSESNPSIRKVQNSYRDQLKFAKRWHTLAETLDVGVLGLIPDRVVSNNWVAPQPHLRVASIKPYGNYCSISIPSSLTISIGFG